MERLLLEDILGRIKRLETNWMVTAAGLGILQLVIILKGVGG